MYTTHLNVHTIQYSPDITCTCYIHVITTRQTDIPADRSLLLEILLREDKVEGDLVMLSLLVHEDINDEEA